VIGMLQGRSLRKYQGIKVLEGLTRGHLYLLVEISLGQSQDQDHVSQIRVLPVHEKDQGKSLEHFIGEREATHQQEDLSLFSKELSIEKMFQV